MYKAKDQDKPGLKDQHVKPNKSLQLLEVTTVSMQKPSTQHTIQ